MHIALKMSERELNLTVRTAKFAAQRVRFIKPKFAFI